MRKKKLYMFVGFLGRQKISNMTAMRDEFVFIKYIYFQNVNDLLYLKSG